MLAKLKTLLNGTTLQQAEHRIAQLEAVLQAVDQSQAKGQTQSGSQSQMQAAITSVYV